MKKKLVRILRKIIGDKTHQWHTQLPYALWANHTTIKICILKTPFQLLYGQEVIIHIELELASLCIYFQSENLNSTNMYQRFHILLTLVEQRNHTLENLK